MGYYKRLLIEQQEDELERLRHPQEDESEETLNEIELQLQQDTQAQSDDNE